MNTMQASGPESTCFELCFQSLVREGCGCAFPCDKDGHVNLDALSPNRSWAVASCRVASGGCVDVGPSIPTTG